MSDSLRLYGLQCARLLCPRDSPGKNIGVDCHALLQGIFLTQGLNSDFLHLLHCRQVLYHRVTGEASLSFSFEQLLYRYIYQHGTLDAPILSHFKFPKRVFVHLFFFYFDFGFEVFLIFTQFLKVSFHLQSLQNIGYIPHIV